MTRSAGLIAALAACAALPQGAGAWDRQGAFYPAAQCAAFWLGRNDYAQLSPYLDVEPADDARAEAFQAAAVRLSGGAVEEVDAWIAEQRPLMAQLFDAMIGWGDAASADLHDDLLADCESFGATQPETADLP